MTPIEIVTEDGGILVFDGRVLEYFGGRQHTSDWRIHVDHIAGWDIEPRKGMSQVKIMVGKREFQNVLVEDDRLPAFEQLRQAVDSARSAA